MNQYQSKSKHIKTVKLARRVYMSVDLRDGHMNFDADPNDMLKMFEKEYRRKPKDGIEFADWTKELMRLEYNKIISVRPELKKI